MKLKGRVRYKGKYVKNDPSNPTGFGRCDRTGFIFNDNDLLPQMKWSGNNKVWTGLRVGRPFIDELQEQDRPPLIKDDPRPLQNPRLPTPYNALSQSPAPPYAEGLAALNKINFMGGVDV